MHHEDGGVNMSHTIYDADTGERLRLATAAEVDAFNIGEEVQDRTAEMYDGTRYGLDGHRVWIDITDPSRSIVGWSSQGTPIFKHFEYMAVFASGDAVEVSGTVAAKFERDIVGNTVLFDGDGYAAGGRYGFPGERVSISVPPDEPALPPPAVQALWKKEWQ